MMMMMLMMMITVLDSEMKRNTTETRIHVDVYPTEVSALKFQNLEHEIIFAREILLYWNLSIANKTSWGLVSG